MARPRKENSMRDFIGLKFTTDDKQLLMSIAKAQDTTLTALIKDSIRQQLGVDIC